MAVILAAVFSVAALLRERLETALPLTLFGITILLYVFGLFNVLNIGFWLLLLLIAAASAAVLARLRMQALTLLLDGLRSPGMILYLLFAFVMFVFTREMQLTHYDEFSHWGRVVKAMFVHDALGPFNPVDLQFRSYPPASSIFEYFVMRLDGRWLEGNLFWGYQLLAAAVFIPFMAGLRWRNPIRIAAAVLLATATALLIRNPLSATLVDPLLGFVFGYLLALIYTSEPRSWRLPAYLSLGLAMFVLIKDVGWFFSVVVLAAYLARLIHNERTADSGPDWARASAHFALPLAGTLMARWSWNAVLSIQDVPRVFAQPIELSKLPTLFTGGSPSFWRPVVRAYYDAFFEEPIISVLGIPMTQVAWLVVSAVVFVLVAVVIARACSKRLDIITPLVIWLGAGAYTGGMLVLYLFRFRENEALRLAGYHRYLGTYWIAVAVFVALCLMWLMATSGVLDRNGEGRGAARRKTEVQVLIGLWCGFLLLAAPLQSAISGLPSAAAVSVQQRQPFEGMAAKIDESGIAPGDRVLIIVREQGLGYEGFMIRYLMLEARANVTHEFSRSAPDDLTETEFQKMMADFETEVSGYSYLVIHTVSPAFVENYGSFFEDADRIADTTIFRVSEENGRLRLVFER